MPVDSMLNVIHSNTDLSVNVPTTISEILLSDVIHFLTTTVTLTLPVLLEKSVNQTTGAFKDVGTMATASLTSLVLTKFVRTPATFSVPVDTTLFVKQSIMIESVHVSPNLQEILKLCVRESNHLQNVLLTMTVFLDNFVLLKDVSLAVDPQATALKNKPVFETSV